MFIYFNENKSAYHKGQLAPFFIAFIILIIIAGLVTINIGKVAKTKTSSANSVDAGVLAAASTMASAFNYIAVANSNMEVNYQYFIGLASVTFVIADIAMASAMASTIKACGCQKCCPDPPHFTCCACYAAMGPIAAGELKFFNQSIVSFLAMVIGYHMLQSSFYKMIRDNVDSYYQSAIDSGHSFAFNNSGISSSLNDDQRDDYRDWLTVNVDNVPNRDILTYSWLDGQGRSHDVANQVIIDPVDDYTVRHTRFSLLTEIPLLTGALISGIIAFNIVVPTPCVAIGFEIAALALASSAHYGLDVNGTSSASWSDILCWIEDVAHNKLVDVYQTQRHQGADLGVWSTEYPRVTSSSRASFAGTGKIHNPNPKYDATITLTDFFNDHLLPELIEPIKDVEGEIQAGLMDNNDDEEEEEEEDEVED